MTDLVCHLDTLVEPVLNKRWQDQVDRITKNISDDIIKGGWSKRQDGEDMALIRYHYQEAVTKVITNLKNRTYTADECLVMVNAHITYGVNYAYANNPLNPNFHYKNKSWKIDE
jgi:hypothetical protein